MQFNGFGFLPTVLEAVLEDARQKMHVVPYLNHSPLNIGYGFYFYVSFNAPFFGPATLWLKHTQL